MKGQLTNRVSTRPMPHPGGGWGDEPMPSRMPKRPLSRRIAGRILRSIKTAVGIDSYLQTEDRRVLEQMIFPYFMNNSALNDIVFVGCDWYTRGYNAWFREKHYCTIELDPSKRKYGAPHHIVDGLQNISRHMSPDTVDAIICNGVFGWGLNQSADVDKAVWGCHEVLRPGGLLVIGVDGVEERRPEALERSHALLAFEPFVFPALGTADYVTDTPYRHRFIFFRKQLLD